MTRRLWPKPTSKDCASSYSESIASCCLNLVLFTPGFDLARIVLQDRYCIQVVIRIDPLDDIRDRGEPASLAHPEGLLHRFGYLA